MLSFCFYTRKFSVLFPSNKYQIKVYLPFFRLFQNGLRCVLFCACRTRVLVALNFTLKVEVGRRSWAGAWPVVRCADATASFLRRLSFGPQLLDPMLLLLGEMLYTLGTETITSRQHGVGKGWR